MTIPDLTRFRPLILALAAGAPSNAFAGDLPVPTVARTATHLVFSMSPVVTGRTYQLQYSDTLAAGSWRETESVLAANETGVQISSAIPVGISKRFYRIPQ